jgi:hypothetical protein
MFTFAQEVDVPEDRKVVVIIQLPPEVPVGVKLALSITAAADGSKRPRRSLSQYFKEHGEDWGEQIRSTDVEGFTGRRF